MTNLQEQFYKLIRQYPDLTDAGIYPTGDGQVALNSDGTQALVWIDGRYPKAGEGQSMNEVCTETIQVLSGHLILEADGDYHMLSETQTFAIHPNTVYSLAGKAVCLVDISPKWNSNQNKKVK